MANVNKVILIGNVTRDPEVKFTPSGKAVATVSLAINNSWKDGDGNKKEEVTFVEVELWGRTAEIAGEYAKKGKPLYVEGRLKQESWEDKTTGQKRSKLKVVCENMQLLGGRDGGAEGGGYREERAPQRPAQRAVTPPAGDPGEDDIPF